MIALEAIRAAAEKLAGKIHRTPMLTSASIGGGSLGAASLTWPGRLVLKAELFQKTGSFKPRGALNRILATDASERACGLVTVSAGNHAQAVAWAARVVGAPCAVVMPTDAPRSKIEAVRGYGAEVILHDDRPTLFDKLEQVRQDRRATFIHPFDDPIVLAGAGTVGFEIMTDLPEADVVVVPVGGGGLLGGVASAVKAMRPACRVVGVELEAGPGFLPALAAGKPVPAPRPAGTLADGMTPPFVGALPLAIVQELGVTWAMVSEAEIRRAMRLLMTRAKLYVEGSGAAAVAALLAGRIPIEPGATVVAIVSGGNIDPARAAEVLADEDATA